MKSIHSIKEMTDCFSKSKAARQISGLLTVNILGIPLGIVTNIIVTRFMGAELFGDYRYILSVFNIAYIIFSLGFFQAGNRALTLNKDKNKARELYGAMFIVTILLYVAMSIAIVLFALLDSNIEEKGLSKFLLTVVPLGFIYLWSHYFEILLPADNQIGLLAKLRIVPKLLNLVFAGLLLWLSPKISANRLYIVFLLYTTTQLITYLYVSIKTKMLFTNLRVNLKEVWCYNKSYGFNVYLGSLVAVGFSSLTDILISYFGANNVGVGYYSLATTLSSPLSFVPATIATTNYKAFSEQARISSKLIKLTLALSIASMLFLWVIVPPFVHYFYTQEFTPVIKLNFFVCIGVLLYGIGDFFNRFIGASGQGKFLRDASFFVGISTLAINVLLIPRYNEFGAAYAKIASGFIYFLVILLYYIKTVKLKKQG